MPHRFQISRDSQALFITLNTKNRLPVFRKDEIKRVLRQAIDEARKSAGFLLFAYVIMIDHLHVITFGVYLQHTPLPWFNWMKPPPSSASGRFPSSTIVNARDPFFLTVPAQFSHLQREHRRLEISVHLF